MDKIELEDRSKEKLRGNSNYISLRDLMALEFASAMIISDKPLYEGTFYEKADLAYEFAEEMLKRSVLED